MERSSAIPEMIDHRDQLKSKEKSGADCVGSDECTLVRNAIRSGVEFVDHSKVLTNTELVDEMDKLFFEMGMEKSFAHIRRDWALFYKGLGYESYFEDTGMGTYWLPYPKVTVGFMEELKMAFRSGEVDYLMIDDGRVCDDDTAMMATFGNYDLARVAYGQSFYKGMAQLNSAEFEGNAGKLSGYRGYTEKFYDFVKEHRADMQAVQLVGLKTFGEKNEVFWEGMDTLQDVFPRKVYRQMLSVGTLVRISSFLRDFEMAINGKLHEDERLHAFLLGKDWEILRSALPLVLNHFNLNGSVMAARCDVDNFRWSMENLPLFGKQKPDKMQANYVNIPTVLCSGGSPFLDVA